MASTRNKNTKGDYCLQQRSYQTALGHVEYQHGPFGSAYNPALPCLGFNPSHMPASTFSKNPVEIESSLFGINSTNLVDPQPEPCPLLTKVQEKAWFSTPELIMPKNLVVSTIQRPFPILN